MLGNALEFYDFLAYSFFAVYIGRAFFPAGTELATLLMSVATFGIGFVTRPIGGIVIGAYADRAGRKPALLLTFGLMSAGTLAVVATPSYATIGIAAPLILVSARLLQGLALGGEVGPSMALLVEFAPRHQRGFYMSFQGASQAAASLMAGIAGLGLSAVLGAGQLADWGWRVPFALGLLIVPVGIYIRRRLPETLHPEGEHGGARVLGLVWREHRRNVALTTLVIMPMTIGTYVIAYMTTFALTTLKLPPSVAMLSPIVSGAIAVAAAPWSGRLSDCLDRRRIMIVSRLSVIAGIYPLFALLVWLKTAWALVLVTAALTVLGVPGTVAAMAAMGELFPHEVRSSGLSLTYAIAVTVFGGTTQLVITWLLGVTHDPLAPAWYVIAASVVSLGNREAPVVPRALNDTGGGDDTRGWNPSPAT